MSFVKRKRDAELEEKQPKAVFGEKEREMLNNQNNDWPMYNHPDGGTVKITPWGSLRQWTDPVSGQATTRFEDVSFQEMSFEMSPDNAHHQCYELPSTPMSLNASSLGQSSPIPAAKFNFSPSNEAELYVVEGYGHQKGPQTQAFTQEYAQEQENYLGMEEREDYSEDTPMA